MDYSLSQFLPSQIAAAAVYITRRASKQKQHWVQYLFLSHHNTVLERIFNIPHKVH